MDSFLWFLLRLYVIFLRGEVIGDPYTSDAGDYSYTHIRLENFPYDVAR